MGEKKTLVQLCVVGECSNTGSYKGSLCEEHKKEHVTKDELLSKILIKKGVKYIRVPGKLVLGCIEDECMEPRKSNKKSLYCDKHLADQSTNLDDIITYEDGKKYIRTENDNNRLGCICENCIRMALQKEFGMYCRQHFNFVEEEERNSIVDGYNKRREKAENWEIVINDGIKYKELDDGRLIGLCKYEGCRNLTQRTYRGDYCDKHSIELGLDKHKDGDIVIQNGIPYVRFSGTLYLACNTKDCSHIGTFGGYCYYCFKELPLNEVAKLVEEYEKSRGKNTKRDIDKFYTNGNTKYRFIDGYRTMPPLCIFENCVSVMCYGKSEHFCQSHYNSIPADHKDQLLSEYQDERRSRIINSVRIYFIENDKLKKDKLGEFVKVCKYDNCTTESIEENQFTYCKRHTGGVDNNLPKKELEKANAKLKQKQNVVNTTKIGDETEKWVEDKLKTLDNIESVERIGYLRHALDITYNVNGVIRGIQVKTLLHRSGYHDDYYSLRECEYDDDTLLVCVNKERTRFAMFFFNQIKKFEFDFCNKSHTNYRFTYTDVNEFLNDLKKKLGKSTKFDRYDINSPKIKQEFQSMDRLKSTCGNLGLEFKFNDTHVSPIDCIINGKGIQCKTTSTTTTKSSYVTHICKHDFGKKVPYSDKDGIEFIIIEIIAYQNTFYIIPFDALIEKGYIHTDKKKGRTNIFIPIPTLTAPHWINEYINRFDLLE
jgi:hypothetical protein